MSNPAIIQLPQRSVLLVALLAALLGPGCATLRAEAGTSPPPSCCCRGAGDDLTAGTLDEVVVYLTLRCPMEGSRCAIELSREDPVVYYMPVVLDPTKPRQVRWVVEGLEPDDVLFLRAKDDQPDELKDLFRSTLRNGEYIVPGRYNTILSGLPRFESADHFNAMVDRFAAYAERTPLRDADRPYVMWLYEVEVKRDGKIIARLDPPIYVQKDPP